MTPSRIMMVNSLLFVAILGLAVFNLLQERELPGPPPVDELKLALGKSAAVQGAAKATGDAYPSLGRKDIFSTIVPPPPPPPKATPTPKPPPRLEILLRAWKVGAITKKGRVFLNDGKDDFDIQLGEERTIEHRGESFTVKLESIDRKTYTATFTMNEMGEFQQHSIGMNDEE